MNPEAIRNILIVQTAFLGDVLLSLPLLSKARQIFPRATIDFLTIPSSVNLLETHPDVHEVLVFDKHGRDRGLVALRRWQKRLLQTRYDLALVPHRSLRSALLVWGARIPVRVGFNNSSGKLLFNMVLPYPKGVHEANRNLFLLKPFGVDPAERIFPQIYFTDSDHLQVTRWLEEVKLTGGRPFICLAPGSVWATKRWLPGRFGELAQRLKSLGFGVVLVGGKDDRSIIDSVLQHAEGAALDASGKFTIRQSALIIKKSQLLVSNDSAPTHLAVAVRTPVVAIFGPTVPAFGFYPYGNHDRVLEDAQLSCRPCSIHGGRKCPLGTLQCMKNITVEMVLEAVREIVDEVIESSTT